jgi:beta-lactamase regulating signal transducer with metallopeptidase domain
MNEAAFPLLGPLIVFAVVLPLSAVAAKVFLWLLAKVDRTSGLHSHQGIRYATLVASSAVPLAWFISASLHQAEDGRSELVCTAEHAPEAFCAEAAYFSLALCALGVAFALPRLLREQLVARAADTDSGRALLARVQLVAERDVALSPLHGHLVVSDVAPSPIATVGIFSPRVVVKTAFAAALDDEALAGALHHELEHFRARDPLRYFIASWARAVNPLGRWLLRGEHARWLLGREAHCDREAVHSGASAVALAHALLIAARPGHGSFSPALGSGHIEGVKLRLGLLLAYADKRPGHCKHGPALRTVMVVLALVFALPHGGETEPLDTIHRVSERAVSILTRPAE